ncbi:MAG: efflux RND transporter periplasmic adaptor subunit [Wenzhouxiangella sp.]|nr:MAG: efflux RND transporter periplasmic adaptor subunit [Wenzhouxiangella sp.]
MNFKFLSIGVMALLLVTFLSACGGDSDPGPSERATAVTLTWPEFRELERVETSIGRLEAEAAPSVAAETSGRVKRIAMDAGESVAEGDVLAELDSETQALAVASAEAAVRRLEAMLENQRVQVNRLRNLAQRQSVAQDQLDEAETLVRVYSAQLDEARARRDDAEINLERTRVLSPVTGQVQRRHVSPGDFVSPGLVLFELVAADALRAVLPLPERLFDELAIGLPVRLSVPARPGQSIEARISEIRPMVGVGSRAMELIVALDNPGQWRVGGSVTGQVILAQREGLVVPLASVVRRPAGQVVFVYDGNDRAIERPVLLGLRSGDWVEVIEGLAGDEAVVVDGAGFLTDGARLEITRWLDQVNDSSDPFDDEVES